MIERQAAVQMKAQLEANGWNVYGYRKDQSDMMTDYYCPSLWWGIAEKEGYVLLVDVFGTGDSGKKVTEKAFTPDPQKVQKLKTLIERGATEGEKQAAQTQLDKLYKKEEENTIVKYEYPTFYNGNPKRCTWHVEKDGEIVAKGTGASDDTLNKGNHKDIEKAVSKLISRIEKRISDNKELVPVEKKEVTKVTKPVEINISLDQVVKGEICLVIDKPLTGGVSKGYVYKLENVTEGKNGNMYRFQRMNKKLNKVLNGTANPANFVYLSESNFNNLYNKGCFHFAKLEEVEEVTYKTVYVSKQRQQKENLLNGTQEEQPKQDKQVKEDNKEQPATKKQLFALHMASNKEVDTRGLNITKQQASELISRSKSGESIVNELKEIAGLNVEEDTQDQETEENKNPQSEMVEGEKQTEKETDLSNEEVKDLEKKYIYNNATPEEEETLKQYHLELQEKAMTFKDSLGDYEALIDDEKVYHVLSIVNKDNGNIGQFDNELTGQELKKELLVNNILDIYTSLEKQEQEPQEQQTTNDNNIDPNVLNEAQELEATYYIK